VLRRAHQRLLSLYGRLPRQVRRFAVRRVAPSFRVGAMCFIERDDRALLLVRHAYRRHWGVPGGLLERGEEPAAAARREAREETDLEIELVSEPVVVIDVTARRIDVVYRCRVPGAVPDPITTTSAEIVEVRWFARHQLPVLQNEAAGALARLDAGGQGQ
jgi:ADP-ribose pyrophosphatase YjhB (NUDIX family)